MKCDKDGLRRRYDGYLTSAEGRKGHAQVLERRGLHGQRRLAWSCWLVRGKGWRRHPLPVHQLSSRHYNRAGRTHKRHLETLSRRYQTPPGRRFPGDPPQRQAVIVRLLVLVALLLAAYAFAPG